MTAELTLMTFGFSKRTKGPFALVCFVCNEISIDGDMHTEVISDSKLTLS